MSYLNDTVRFKLNTADKDRIKQAAKSEGKGLSRFVREAIEAKMQIVS